LKSHLSFWQTIQIKSTLGIIPLAFFDVDPVFWELGVSLSGCREMGKIGLIGERLVDDKWQGNINIIHAPCRILTE
jgi:hypothetical protein